MNDIERVEQELKYQLENKKILGYWFSYELNRTKIEVVHIDGCVEDRYFYNGYEGYEND